MYGSGRDCMIWATNRFELTCPSVCICYTTSCWSIWRVRWKLQMTLTGQWLGRRTACKGVNHPRSLNQGPSPMIVCMHITQPIHVHCSPTHPPIRTHIKIGHSPTHIGLLTYPYKYSDSSPFGHPYMYSGRDNIFYATLTNATSCWYDT